MSDFASLSRIERLVAEVRRLRAAGDKLAEEAENAVGLAWLDNGDGRHTDDLRAAAEAWKEARG